MAIETNFTPGPWKVTRVDYPGRRDVSFEVVAGAQNTVILQTHMRDLQSYEAELIPTDEANCNLAAAAPEMYEALKAVQPFVKRFAEHAEQRFGIMPADFANALQAIETAFRKVASA